MISISKSELTRVKLKIQALESEQNRLFKQMLDDNDIEEMSVEADYLFDVVFNDTDYANHPAFNGMIEVRDE